MIDVTVQNKKFMAIVDSGATENNISDSVIKEYEIKISDINK